MPFGAGLVLWGRKPWHVLAIALLVSFAIEFSQSLGYPAGRSAATADVIANGIGGLIGAGLAANWRWLLIPPPRASAMLALGWSTMGALVFVGTGYALSPRPSDSSVPVTFSPSAFPHAPGFGWYEDVNDSAIVADYHVKRGWTGPIIVSASRGMDSLQVQAFVRGRDPTTAFVPIAYVHVGLDTAPIVLLGQHDNDAELRVTRRAWDLGLNFPALRLRSVFSGRRNGDGVPLTVTTTVAPSFLLLSGHSTIGIESAKLRLTPTLGWALIQTVVESGTRFAPVASACWLLFWSVPIGWFGGGARRHRWWVLLSGTALLQLGAVLGTSYFHMAAIPWTHTGIVTALIFGIGWFRVERA